MHLRAGMAPLYGDGWSLCPPSCIGFDICCWGDLHVKDRIRPEEVRGKIGGKETRWVVNWITPVLEKKDLASNQRVDLPQIS